VRHVVYLAILAACVLGTLPLEFLLGTGVYARWRRLALTLAPVLVVFGGWDVWAIARHDWAYDGSYLVGLTLPGRLPVEELLFFLVIPTCAVLTLEAVRSRRPDWTVGDEPPACATGTTGVADAPARP
jgi:lycopene cyclase domain-containing protein